MEWNWNRSIFTFHCRSVILVSSYLPSIDSEMSCAVVQIFDNKYFKMQYLMALLVEQCTAPALRRADFPVMPRS